MSCRKMFGAVLYLAIAGGSLLAHDPHDPMVTVAVSPNFAQDSTALAATDYLSIKIGLRALLKTTDGGVTWSPLPGLPGTSEMWAVVFSPAYSQDQTIFVAGYGGLYKSTNQGATWTVAFSQRLANMAVSPNFASDNTLFVITAASTVYESTDGGQTFTQLALPASLDSAPTAMAVSPNFDVDGTLLLGSTSDGIFESGDGGATWDAVVPSWQSGAVNALVFSPGFSTDQTAFAATAEGVLFSTDGGVTWPFFNTGLSEISVNSITLSPNYLTDCTMWAATAVFGIFQSTNQGITWTPVAPINRELSNLTNSHYRNVAAANTAGGIVLILATYEGLWTSPSGSISWQYVDTVPTRIVTRMPISPNFANDQTLFCNTYGGGNLWSTSGGSSWFFQNTGMKLPYTGAGAISPNFAVDQTAFSATNNVLARTSNSGANWQTMQALGVLTHVRAVGISPAFATDSTVLIGTDNAAGSTYPPFVFYQGQLYPNQGLFLSVDGGNNWIPTSLGGPPIVSIAVSKGFATDRTAFAASPTGGLFKSTDGGMTWTPVPLPGAPQEIELVSLSPAFATDQNVYVALGKGGLLKSTNGGATWTTINHTSNLLVVDLQISPNYAADQTFFAATSQSGVMKSTNAGKSLIPLSGFPDVFVTALAVSPNFQNDLTVFAAGYHSIFKSQDGGSTWTDTIEPARIEESRTVDSNTQGQPPPTIAYQGNWSSNASNSASTDGFMSTATSQNTAVLNFTGTGVRWVSVTGPRQGSATILLDGVSQGTVSLTTPAPPNQYGQVVWEQQGLPCAPHTLTISATPKSNQTVTLDAFDIWINGCAGASANAQGH